MDFNFWNGLRNVDQTEVFIDNPFALALASADYIKLATKALYKKILTDCLTRTDGLKENTLQLYSDSCLATEVNEGLISILVNHIYQKDKGYIIYDPALNLLRETKDQKEREQIAAGQLKNAVVCDFSKFTEKDLIALFYSLIFSTLSGLNTQINISKTLLFKFKDLRKLVSKAAADSLIPDAKKLNEALKNGKSIMIDAEDLIEAMKLDIGPINTAQEFLQGQIAGIINQPISYITGALSSGLSNTGEADSSANERGLLNYFYSILKPVSDQLFGVDVKFISNNWRVFSEKLNALPIIETSEYISEENKTKFAEDIFNEK